MPFRDEISKLNIERESLGCPNNVFSFGENVIKITTTTLIPVNAWDYLDFCIGDGTGDDVALPYVASNKATFYETWVTATTGS